ncbi:MAG: acyltransferase [Eubacteriales bacterium]|nr:acyltransferase [Eubacteriales bacterium]
MNKRDDYWDFLKGLGIFTVFYAHTIGGWNYIDWGYYIAPDSLNYSIWLFFKCVFAAAIPVFFFISGYFTPVKIESAGEYYKKRGLRIIIPFFVWSGIYSLVNLFIYKQDVTLLSFILGTNGIQLYFLAAMIQLMLLTPMLTAAKNKKLMLIICVLITLINDILHLRYWIVNNSIPNNEMILFTCFIAYYYLGIYFKANVDVSRLNCRRMRIISAVLVALVFAAFTVSAFYLNFLTDSTNVAISYNNPLNLFYSIALILFIMSFKDLYKSNAFNDRVAWVGKMSMEFFTVHWIFMNPIKTWAQRVLMGSYYWSSHFVISAITFVLCLVYIWIRDRMLTAANRNK